MDSENKEKTVEEIRKILDMQEEILQFSHFTNEDAIALGNYMLQEAVKKELSISISIRRCNGAVIYQAMREGTNLDNISWMNRKFNTVLRTEVSSLSWFMRLKQNDQTMADKFMDENIYACVGGGFPIRVEDAGVVGVILVSGMNHVQDHDFIVKTLGKYLHINEVPRISRSDVR